MIEHYAERNPINIKPYSITRVKEMESEKGKEQQEVIQRQLQSDAICRWKSLLKTDCTHEEGLDTSGVFYHLYFSNNMNDKILRTYVHFMYLS